MFSKGVLRAIGNEIIRPAEKSVAKSTLNEIGGKLANTPVVNESDDMIKHS